MKTRCPDRLDDGAIPELTKPIPMRGVRVKGSEPHWT